MKALAAYQIVRPTADGRYRSSPLGRLLAADVDGSLWPTARSVGEPWNWEPWASLTYSIRTGEPAFEARYGATTFDYFRNNPEANDLFARRMTVEGFERGRRLRPFLAARRSGLIVDVGGGQGAFLAGILAGAPQQTGKLFDLPHVVEGAPAILRSLGVEARIEVVPGDFWESVPTGGDVYVLSAILHSWDDESSVKLLRRCRASMSNDSLLVLLDEVLGDPMDSTSTAAHLLMRDLQLMVNTRGRQRTAAELGELIQRGGFTVQAEHPLDKNEVAFLASPS